MRRLLLAVIGAALAAPSGVYAQSVTCADGTTSEAGRGACSHHGGIAKTRAPTKRTEKRATKPKVLCNDGSYSSATGRGACSRHGGVAGDVAVDRDRSTRKTDSQARRTDTRTRTEPRTEKRDEGSWLDQWLGRDQADSAPRETREKRDRPWWGSDEPRPGEPLARCMDGTLSYSKTHRGTCSHHGGVRDWLDD